MKLCKNCAGSRIDKKGRCHYCGTQIEARGVFGPGSIHEVSGRNSEQQSQYNAYQQAAMQQQMHMHQGYGLMNSALSGGLAGYLAGGGQIK